MYHRILAAVLGGVVTTAASYAGAQDWPQWRGPHRDGKAAGFKAPRTWPQELTQKWKVTVGDGVATPALVGDKLYVFSRQDGQEVTRCLDAATGREVWQDKYEAADSEGAAARFPVPGPRSSPTVAEGKVVTLGTRGTLSCLDAETGEQLWRKDDFHAWPRFFVASSPLIVDGLSIAQLGGDSKGGIVAYDLATGDEKWKWIGDGPAYGSPVLATVGDTEVVIAPTAGKLVAVRVADGKLLWQVSYEQGRYNAATPMVDGETIIYAGPTRGMTAEKLVQHAGELVAEPQWRNPDNSVMYNTPVLKRGLLFGLSNLNSLFCINVQTGETAWNAPVDDTANAQGQPATGDGRGRGGRRGRRGGGSGGYGSIVDAGDVLLALTPAAELIAFQPSDQAYTEVARYKVAEGSTYSYPVVAGNRIFIKDKDSITLWTLE